MKIAIGSTRAGLALKDELIPYLQSLGHETEDVGMKQGGPFVPYYESAAAVAAAVSRGDCPLGIAICGTGAGSVIVANKFRNVYAVHAASEYEGKRAKSINNANVLVLAEWLTPSNHAREIVQTWLTAEFGEGFEPDWQKFLKDACDKVCEIENQNLR